MKKILMLLLVCTLVFSLTLTMTSCNIFNNGKDEPDNGDETPGGNDTPGDDTGVDSDDTNIFDGINNAGNGGISLPIIDVNSTDMTQPEGGEGTEEGAEEGTEETPDAE